MLCVMCVCVMCVMAQVSIYDPLDATDAIESVIDDLEDGSYTASFTPAMSGLYTIQVHTPTYSQIELVIKTIENILKNSTPPFRFR